MHKTPDKKTKKKRNQKLQYLLWYRRNGRRVEYGPVYDKKAVERDVRFYQRLLGEKNAGYDVFGAPRERERDDY